MTQWLYHEVLKVDPSRQPTFALQSAVNWIAALAAEVTAEHGTESDRQLASCRAWFKQTVKPRQLEVPSGSVFEPLFAAITGAMALKTLSRSSLNQPWCRPPSAVSWYYSVYAASRSMLAALNQPPRPRHAATRKAYAAALQRQLPHPFDMLATRFQGEQYSVSLPNYPAVTKYQLSRNFVPDRAKAQGMLLEYLQGTSEWYAEVVKARLRKELKITNFRTRDAQETRNESLESNIAFLHCAYRYRGKANYRDSIYMCYGLREPSAGLSYTRNLADTAAFLSLAAIAFVERRIGHSVVSKFLEDLRIHLRGYASAHADDAFWHVALEGLTNR